VASLDSIIRTFDIPTGKLIDAFKPASVATSLSFSPTGDFLATAHVDSVGVYLWCVERYAWIAHTFDCGLPGQIEHSMQKYPYRVSMKMLHSAGASPCPHLKDLLKTKALL
jgi:WD40 repeat protein